MSFIRVTAILAVAVAASALTGPSTVTEFPPLSLYCGSGDFSAAKTDNLGAFAVYGNVQVQNYAAGSGLPPSPPGSRDTGVVQGAGSFVQTEINNGNLVYCGKLSQNDLTIVGGTLIKDCNRFDFDGTNAFLSTWSKTFSQLPATGAATRINEQFYFNSNPSVTVNIFYVDSYLFDNIDQMTITAAANQWVIINVKGDVNTFQNFQITVNGGITNNRIIYNFFETVKLIVQDIGVEGSVVAPAAAVSFNNGHIDGSFFVASLSGNGEIHYFPPITPPCPITPCPPCPTIAPFPPYSAFAINTIISENSDDLGTMAGGGDVTLQSYSINLGTKLNGTCPVVLVVGGDLKYTYGGVNGGVVVGGTGTLTDVGECSFTQHAGRNAVVDFDVAAANLKSISYAYGQRPATNPTVRMLDEITLKTGATPDGVSVFAFPSSLLAGCTGLNVIAPEGQLVIINVNGQNNTIANFNTTLTGGVDAAHVLWNYYESVAVSIQNVYVIGTTLAPLANVYFNHGQLHGALYADSISGYGEYHPLTPVTPICPICPVNPCNTTVSAQ